VRLLVDAAVARIAEQQPPKPTNRPINVENPWDWLDGRGPCIVSPRAIKVLVSVAISDFSTGGGVEKSLSFRAEM